MNLRLTNKNKPCCRGFGSGAAISLLFWLVGGSNHVSAETPTQNTHDIQFQKYTEKFFGRDFDWRLFKSQGFVESRLRQQAKSPRGAKGVMQIMPATYREIQRKNSYFREQAADTASINIAAGIFYDYYLYNRWGEKNVSVEMRMKLMLASYNAGYSRALRAWNKAGRPEQDWDVVNKHLPKETSNYVSRVISHYEKQIQTSPVVAQRGNGCPVAATFERSFC